MKMQKRRSLASTVRLSLLAGAGALGWAAIGASGASAAEVPADSGLLGSVTGVVEPATAPVTSTMSALTAPLHEVSARAFPVSTGSQPQVQNLPVLSDVAALVPQLTSQPAGTVLTPVTRIVDGVVAEVPVVQSVIPAGTVTGVTAPVVGTVDDVVGGVAQPVMDVVAPVVDVIDPVVDVVLPVPELASPAPVVPGPAPITDILPDLEQPASVPTSASPSASSEVSGADIDARPAEPSSGIASDTASAGGAGTGGKADGVAVLRAFLPMQDTFSAAIPAGIFSVAVLPGVVGAAQAGQEIPGLPAVPLSTTSVLSSMTGTGSAAPLIALGGASFLIFLLLAGVGRHSAGSVLPSSPSFDPGSSPD